MGEKYGGTNWKKGIFLYRIKIVVRIYEITDVYEKAGTVVTIGSCIHMPLSSIGKSFCIGNEWFTFERDDSKARMVLYENAKNSYFLVMKTMFQEMFEKMELFKTEHNKLIATIEHSEIEKDQWYLEKYEQD